MTMTPLVGASPACSEPLTRSALSTRSADCGRCGGKCKFLKPFHLTVMILHGVAVR